MQFHLHLPESAEFHTQCCTATERIPFTILFSQFFDNFYQPKVQRLSRHIGHISVQALHLWRHKARLLEFCFSYHSAIPEKFSTTLLSLHVLTLAFLGFRKAREQDAMSSSVRRRKVQNLYLKCFSRTQISNIHESIIVMKSIDTRFLRNVFEAVQNTRSTCFIGSKTTRLRIVVLNPIYYMQGKITECWLAESEGIFSWSRGHFW